jgi:alkylhydroperoxidase family enzyme
VVLKQHFSEEQIVDLDALVTLVNFTNRMTDVLGAEVEFPQEKI